MSAYGIQPTGYVRKPISVILAELEAAMVTEFGPGVIQTPQSPLGQLNGLMADLLAEVDERNLDLYQSYDPDQAEGARLDVLARLRLLSRFSSDDVPWRKAITNEGAFSVKDADVETALRSVSSVSFVKFWPRYAPGTVAIAILGGDADDLVPVIRKYIVPGIATYGNISIESVVNGACMSFNVIRPIDVPVTLNLVVRAAGGCPAPSTLSIAQKVAEVWDLMRENGMEVSHFRIRTVVESNFSGMELVSLSGVRDGDLYQGSVPIDFLELASLTVNVVLG